MTISGRSRVVVLLVVLITLATSVVTACAGSSSPSPTRSQSALTVDISGGTPGDVAHSVTVRALPGAGQPDIAELNQWGVAWSEVLTQVTAELDGPYEPRSSSDFSASVVVVPPDTVALEDALNRPRGALRNIAAVTMPPGAGDEGDAGAVVWLNREALRLMSRDEQQIVLRHEAVHVIEGDAQRDGVPLWLEEGFAELVAHGRANAFGTEFQAPTEAVTLPTDEDFVGSTSAYINAWAACAWIAGQGRGSFDVGVVRQLRDRIAMHTGEGRDVDVATTLALADIHLSRDAVIAGAAEVVAQWASGAPSVRARSPQ